MKTIFNKYPDIGDSFVQLLNLENPGLKDQFFRQFTDKNKLAAVQELDKLTSDLSIASAMGVPAKGLNVFMEKQLSKAAPRGRLVKSAFDNIANLWEKRAKDNIDRAKYYQHALKKRYIPIEEDEVEAPSLEEIHENIEMTPSISSKTVTLKTPDGKVWPNFPANQVQQAMAKYRGTIELKNE